ncbi:MAG: hypothetical protein KDH15_04795 [Rhodocyclaceae bacterium]|nr:hypothetical protein [Rhodocyclaceae bacterium]
MIKSFFAAISLSLSAGCAFGCTIITGAPVTIAAPGQYCLDQDLVLTLGSEAIRVTSDDVSIDLKGYSLIGPHYGGVAGSPLSIGVKFDQVSNAEIRNGRISGFGTGVQVIAGIFDKGALVEDLLVDTVSATAIAVVTSNAVIRNNRIQNVSGFLQANCVCSQSIIGISAKGNGIQISGNSILGMTSPNSVSSNAITISFSSNALIEGNLISTAGTQSFTGVRVSGNSGLVSVVDNKFLGTLKEIVFADSAGVYSRNISADGMGTYIGGTPVGDNF